MPDPAGQATGPDPAKPNQMTSPKGGLAAVTAGWAVERGERERSARRTEMVWIIAGGIIYLILVVTLGVMSIRGAIG